MSASNQSADGEQMDEDKGGNSKQDDPQAALMQEYEELV